MSDMRRLQHLWTVVLLLMGATLGAQLPRQDSGPDGEESPRAEPYIFHPRESELVELAASGVARLVSAGLSSRRSPTAGREEQEKAQEGSPPPDLIARLLGLLGYDSSRLSAIALNALIFIAQLISTTLTGPKHLQSEPPAGEPTSWIFENSPIEARLLVKEATEQTLPERLIEAVRDNARISTDCVELLLCKGSPLLRGMQESLSRPPRHREDWPHLSPLQRMYSDFPAVEEVASEAARCDVRFPACRIKYGREWD